MAYSAPTLASNTLAHPTSYTVRRGYRGGQSIMADGSLSTDLVSATAKRTWDLGWDALTDAQRTTLQTAFDAIENTSGTYVDIDGTSYTVTLDEGDIGLEFEAVKVAGSGNMRWRTSLQLRQV
jgi:hypothetical protein